LTRLPGIQQMQVVQEEALKLTVNLVPAPKYGPATEAALVAALQEYLGTAVTVQVAQVARIPQEESGKYRFTICRI
jgi:phenylacetate-CoA ligase